MSAPTEHLTPLLKAELDTLESLNTALTAEYEALVGNNVEDLERATATKNQAISAHQIQQKQRLSWMHGLGLTVDSSLGDLVRHCGNDETDIRLQEELANLATQCQESNRRNGGLIHRLQERTRGALDVLRHEEGSPNLYSLSGSREHQSDSRTLGKA